MANEARHKRLRILRALTKHLEGINGVDPYQFDVSETVYRGRDMFGPHDPLPALSILEGKATDYGTYADDNNSVRKDEWLLLVQGWVKDDTLNPTDPAYELLYDVELRLSDIVAEDHKGKPKFPGIYLLGGLISSLRLASPVVRPPEEAMSARAFFYLPVLVGLKTDLTKP